MPVVGEKLIEEPTANHQQLSVSPSSAANELRADNPRKMLQPIWLVGDITTLDSVPAAPASGSPVCFHCALELCVCPNVSRSSKPPAVFWNSDSRFKMPHCPPLDAVVLTPASQVDAGR